MKRGMVAVGLTCLILGAFVAVVPVFPVPSGDKQVNGTTVAYFQVHSLVLPQYLQVPWNAGTSTHITAIDCGGTEPNGAALNICPSNRTVASGTGTSGTLTFSAQNGDWIAIGTNGPNASISLRTTNGQVGFVVLVLGALFTVAGLLLGRGEPVRAPPSSKKGASKTSKGASPATEEAGPDEEAPDVGKDGGSDATSEAPDLGAPAGDPAPHDAEAEAPAETGTS